MVNEDSFQYAVENTRVVWLPSGASLHSGTPSFHFYLITELMDSVSQVRVRDGMLHAERPRFSPPDTTRVLFRVRTQSSVHSL